MPALIAENALFLILAIAGFWFTARVLGGPRNARSSLSGIFSREKPVSLTGLGKVAIATLLEDTRKFVVAAPDLRGLILAGPFAIEAATSQTPVTLIILAEDIEPYCGKPWLARWGYPARGHMIMEHKIEIEGSEARHNLTLRGSPPLRIHFVRMDLLDPPATLKTALAEGTATIEDPTGIAEKIRVHWAEQARKSGKA